MTDAERLDWLEAELKRQPILLHNLTAVTLPIYCAILGLCPWNPRTLRQVIDDRAMDDAFRRKLLQEARAALKARG